MPIASHFLFRDIGMHKLVFEDDNLPDGSEVSYIHNEQVAINTYEVVSLAIRSKL